MPESLSCVLVANRGEVVSRVARTARRHGLLVAGTFTASDTAARYVDDLDVAIDLGPDTGPSPYLDIEVMLDAAARAGADAIHPGYGFLAESAAFARAVRERGLVWIGPTPEAMEAMARKVEAKALAAEAGVPVLASVTVTGDLDAAAREVAGMPMPVLVKPSAGGGGKGMRVVEDPADVRAALEQSQREAVSSFGDGTLFVERYIRSARHVEVQLLGDRHGTVVHLGERDCSIQRRHQKIVEETPAPGLPPRLREELHAAAVRLAQRIGYESAGTVEFLVHGEEFSFLEMNTRLQVEHGVTEEVTGIDIVAEQLAVAVGRPLSFTQDDVRLEGHSVQVRLYAEDPARDFLPSPGTVSELDCPDLPGVRWEHGIRSGSEVGTRFDPMLSKVIATGRDREAALDLMVDALRRLFVAGVRTNRSLLTAILREPDFRAGRVATDYLAGKGRLPAPERPGPIHVAAAVLFAETERRAAAAVQQTLPAGWRNVPSQPHLQTLVADGEPVEVGYARRRDGRVDLTVAGERHVVAVHGHDAGSLDLSLDGRRQRCRVHRQGQDLWIATTDGFSCVLSEPAEADTGPRGSAAAVATVPGTVVALHVAPGEAVEEGSPLLAIESMKMEHTVRAAASGVVSEVHVRVGQNVDAQQLMVTVQAATDG